MAGEAQQLRVSTYPWAGWRDLIGNADMLHMCLITHQGAGMILAQTWHILQWVNTIPVHHIQAESPLISAKRELELEVCTTDCASLSPGSRLCFPPSSTHVPQETQAQPQYGSIISSHCSYYPPVACKEELKWCSI